MAIVKDLKKVIRVTNEEKDLLYAAEMLHDYCDKVACEDCFFYRGTLLPKIRECVLKSFDPWNWPLKLITMEEGDKSET